ncbi:MAG: D-2-hydroxyacid dehydrogenase [Oscillospiraceae bacterium]|jgi:glycerate dehydrogenase|nr:D-2-hydroxyacid dehydrogenase [Oscillospiraceae bacterium]
MKKTKAVVMLGNPQSVDITREELDAEWREKLGAIEDIEYEIVPYPGGFRLTPEEMSALVPSDAESVFGMWVSDVYITEDFLKAHPKLSYIAGLSHGYGEVDFDMTRRYGVTITNTAYGDRTIAEYAFALLLAVCHRVELHSDYVKNTKWWEPDPPQYMRTFVPQTELFGKTLGIIGLGKIGLCTARIAAGFGMNVLANSRRVKTGGEYDGIEQVGLDELYARSDVISVHAPLTARTRGMIDGAAFEKMRDGVIFINTSRGALVDEDALADALDSGKVSFAGLDVLVNEPPTEPSRLLAHKNALITAHIAWLPKSSRMRQVSVAVQNYLAYLGGSPVSVIGGAE